MLKFRPRLVDLAYLIDKVPDYPVSVAELADLAAGYAPGSNVADFYLSFPPEETFTSKEDLITRTEQVVLMNEDHDQPPEMWHSSEED